MHLGFVGLLTLLFIGLKLGDVIDWSWWWVLSPSIASLALTFLLIVGAGIASIKADRRDAMWRARGRK